MTRAIGRTMRMMLGISMLLAAGSAFAGDRQAGVVYANFTPDAQSTAASKACFRVIEKKLTDQYTIMTRLGETALRKRAGKTAGEAPFSWPKAAWDAVKAPGADSQRDTIDVVMTVDCRPEAKSLEIAFSPPSGGVAKLLLRGIAIDDAAIQRMAEAVVLRAWSGFSP